MKTIATTSTVAALLIPENPETLAVTRPGLPLVKWGRHDVHNR